MGIALRLCNDAGVETHELPDFEKCTVSPVFCDAGTLEFTYPLDGQNFSLIAEKDEFRVHVYLDGVYYPELDAWIKDASGDDVEETGVWTFTGWLANGRLTEAVVYPEGWDNYDPDNPAQVYTDNTPGYVLRKLIINEAQQRGALAGLFLDNISASQDSAGLPWGRLISQELKPGTDYLEVMNDFFEAGILEFQVVGNRLRVYNYNGLSTDRTVGANPVTFRAGRDMVDAPRKRTSRGRDNVLLVEGSEGVYIERKDTVEISARRRIEAPFSYSESNSPSILSAYADLDLQKRKYPALEVSHGLAMADPAQPKPLINFDVGDWVYSDTRHGLERLRVFQWTVSQEADGTMAGSVVLNDLFAGRIIRLNKKLKKVVKGKTKTGTSKKTPPKVPVEVADNMPPAAPTNVTGFGVPYIDNNQYFAKVTASWAQVTTNADGSALFDLHHYLVSYRQPNVNTGWSPGQDAALQTTLTWYPIVAGQLTEVRVAAVDKWNNISAWSTVASFTTPADTEPPPVPTTPVVDSYLGMIRVRWDGAFVAAAAKPFDFNRVEVHVGTTATFTPSSSTLISSLRTEGDAFTTAGYGTQVFAKLIAVDELGNKSAASTVSAGVAAVPVVSADVFNGAIGSSKLADLAVVTAKIADLAVNNAKIASLDVGKLTAGTISAAIVNAGRFTTALTGARTEFNSAGFYRFDASGNTLVAIDGSGNLLTGTFKTGLTGRRIEMVSGGSAGEITLYAPDGRRGFIRSYTQTTGQEAIQIGMSLVTGAVANNLWNRITINASTAGEYMTYRSGTHEFIYDSTAPNANGRFVVYQTDLRGESPSFIRFVINSQDTWMYYPLSGDFVINERSEAGTVDRTRLWFRNLRTSLYHHTGGDTTFYERLNDGSVWGRLQIGDTENWMKWPGDTGMHGIYIRRNDDYIGTGNGSPYFKGLNNHGFGYTMEFRSTNTGASGRLDFKDAIADNYISLTASAFTVSSTRASKRGVEDVASMSEKMRGVKVKKWRRPPAKDDKNKPGDEDLREYMGPIAEEAPAEIVVLDENGAPAAIDLNSYISSVLKYVQELEARVGVLEGGKSK